MISSVIEDTEECRWINYIELGSNMQRFGEKQLNNKLTKLSCYENNIYGRNKGETLSVDNHTARDKEVT